MGQRLIESLDGLKEKQFNSNPARHQGILIVAEGTNNAGQVGGFADIGKFLITRNGTQTHNRNCKRYADIGDIRAGANILNSTDGDTFEASVYIPFYEIGFPNALNITGQNELNISFQPGDDGTVFNDLTVRVFADVADLPESYQYFMLGNDLSYDGQFSGPEKLAQENITSLYMDDLGGNLNKVQFEQNDKVVVTSVNFLALVAQTIYRNRIEDNTFDVAQIMAATPGVKGSTVGRNSKLNIDVSGAGDIALTVCSMQWRGRQQ